jgi:hypothetical protein
VLKEVLTTGSLHVLKNFAWRETGPISELKDTELYVMEESTMPKEDGCIK